LWQVIRRFAAEPGELLIRRWNWKSALLSSLIRGGIFFFTNLKAGFAAAAGAMMAEFALRTVTSGFCGSLTQAFRRVEPAWHGTIAVLLLLPVANHGLEFLLHWWRGTPALALSIGVSVGFTCFSTSFNYFAMRRGLLTVGHGSRTLLEDLAQIPRVVVAFVVLIGRILATPFALLRSLLRSRTRDLRFDESKG
jgi:hypothetical protein